MRFAGKVWRLLVGIKDGLVLVLLLLFFGLLYALLAATPTVGSVSRGALLLDLSGPIVEQPSQPTPTQILAGTRLTREHRLRDIVHALRRAPADDRVKAVVLDLDLLAGGGQAALAQVGEALDAVRRSGKPVLAYASGYGDDTYQLAAHASEVWVDPMGGVVVTGPGGSGLYYKGLLDKLGVTANVYRAGTYKAATEPLTRNDMSPEAEQAMRALAGQLWESYQGEIKRARPKAQLIPWVAAPLERTAAAGGDLARAALAAGLVDRLGDRTAFGRRVAALVGEENEAVPGSFNAIPLDAYVAEEPAGDAWGSIGVVTVAGNIIDGEAGPGTAGAETIVQAIERGLREHSLSALVLRVDSPGGSTLASERIRRAVLAAKSKGLPVVVSMGSTAASGGYWIATAGDHIMAEPTTITGSIGVFGVLPSFERALEKLGLGADGVKTTPLSGEPDLLRGPSAEADQLIQIGVNNTYRRFLELVSRARKLPIQRVDQMAQGRVWDGGTARQLGLVDSFGSLDDAVAEAARRAGEDPEEAEAVFLEREPSFTELMLQALAGGQAEQASRDVFTRIAAEPRALLLQALADAERILGGPAIQARCLECPAMALPGTAGGRARPPGWLWQLLAL